MDARFPPDWESATSEYVLSVIRDRHRQAALYDPEVDEEADLGFETTVADWCMACDLASWKKLALALNAEWGMQVPPQKWHPLLKNKTRATLGDVCRLIAHEGRKPVIRPSRLLGGNCLTAGAFRTIRSILIEAGADGTRIRPSTPLAGYVRKYWVTLAARISMLAPGRIPPIKVKSGVARALGWFALLFFAGGFAGWGLSRLVSWQLLQTVAGSCFLLGTFCLPAALLASLLPPSEGHVGDLKTFGDLACALADEKSLSR